MWTPAAWPQPRRSGAAADSPEEVGRRVLAKRTAPAPLSGRLGQKPKGSYGGLRGCCWRLFGQPVPRSEDPGAAASASAGAASPPGVAIETGWHAQCRPRVGEAWRGVNLRFGPLSRTRRVPSLGKKLCGMGIGRPVGGSGASGLLRDQTRGVRI